ARDQVPAHARQLLRGSARSRGDDRRAARGAQALGDPRRSRRRGLSAPGVHRATRRPSDDLLRDHRAPRRAGVRRGQLQGAVSGDRARAGKAGEPLAMRYLTLGEVPRKRHMQVRTNGRLLIEEVMGYEGFSGNESILYHRHSPCRIEKVGAFESIVREEWVPEAHVHRLADLNGVQAEGDPLSGRRLLMWSPDLEVSICKPTEPLGGFYRDGEGDELIYVHRGSGVLR